VKTKEQQLEELREDLRSMGPDGTPTPAIAGLEGVGWITLHETDCMKRHREHLNSLMDTFIVGLTTCPPEFNAVMVNNLEDLSA